MRANSDPLPFEPTVTLDDERSLWRKAIVTTVPVGTLTTIQDEVEPPGDHGEAGRPAVRYQIREVLGAGGMGEVRRCRDEAIGREVALKTLLADQAGDPRAQRRFLREARVQGQLEHPSIVPVYDLGTGEDGGVYFTMRRVEGHTLQAVLEGLARGDAALTAAHGRRKLLGDFVRVCLAVDYAHARGVLHRDLKPSNVMLGAYGEVYVLDWGVAKLAAERATAAPVVVPRAEMTGQGSKVGTPGYMSPEQVLGLGDLQDARSDVYALGAILFEILTLRRLHQGASFEEIAVSTSLPPARASAVAADVPLELDAICARAVAPQRADRYAGARELSDAIERYLDGDRDLARRRELGAARVEAASAAFARAAREDLDPDEAGHARADAVREVTAALALDPDNAEARQLLVRLFVEAPSRTPPEVLAEMEAATQRSRAQYLRFGTYGLGLWLLLAPVVALMGVRAWLPLLVTAALCLAALLYGALLRRAGDLTAARVHVLSALVLATLASTSCFMGPFVLVPQAVAVTTLYIALQCRNGGERRAAIALGAVAVALPFALETLGLVSPGYVFAGGNVTLVGRLLPLTPAVTLPLLVYASVTFVALPAVLLGGVRDALSSAERRLFLQSWHLRQLVPERHPSP